MSDPAGVPQVPVPLDDFVREIAREAARTVIDEHRKDCPIEDVDKRLTTVELRMAKIIGVVIGSGLSGGLIGGLISQLTTIH